MIRFAEALLREAGYRIETAERVLKERKYAYCLRQSQEAAELSLKAALRSKGIEYPKFHDVSEVLLKSANLFPKWFAEKIPEFANDSRTLAEKREASTYGFEASGEAPEKLISGESARNAFQSAQRIFLACRRLMRGKT